MDHHARSPGVLAVGVAFVGTVLLSPLMLVFAVNGLFLGVLLLPVFPVLALGWLAAGSLRRATTTGAALGARREAVQSVRPAPLPATPQPVIPLSVVPLAAAEAVTYAAAPLTAVAAADAMLAPVKLRVASARGTCPMGYRYETGTEYVFLNGEVSPAFCPVARRALTPLVTQVRRGEIPGTLKPFCKTSVHEVVFEFAMRAPAAAQEKEPALP